MSDLPPTFLLSQTHLLSHLTHLQQSFHDLRTLSHTLQQSLHHKQTLNRLVTG
jgi:hypothetical protein